MLKSIRESAAVTATVTEAAKVYPRAWEAFEGLCWLLARGGGSNIPAGTDQRIYNVHRQAAGGFGVPGFTIIYSVTGNIIDLHSIRIN